MDSVPGCRHGSKACRQRTVLTGWWRRLTEHVGSHIANAICRIAENKWSGCSSGRRRQALPLHLIEAASRRVSRATASETTAPATIVPAVVAALRASVTTPACSPSSRVNRASRSCSRCATTSSESWVVFCSANRSSTLRANRQRALSQPWLQPSLPVLRIAQRGLGAAVFPALNPAGTLLGSRPNAEERVAESR
jgi:hypothetical protein